MLLYDYLIHLPNKIFFPFFKEKNIYKSFQKTGTIHIPNDEDNVLFSKLVFNQIKRLDINNLIKKQLESNPDKYQFDVFCLLEKTEKKKILDFFGSKQKKKLISSMLGYKVKLRDVSLKINYHNRNLSENEGPKMFHRDSDSLQDQVKLFLLVNNIKDNCGMFYYVPKNFISDKYILPFEKEMKNMKVGDKWRNFDSTVKKALQKLNQNTDHAIKKLEGKQGEALYIDTGKIYHKGGHVSFQNNLRILFQAVYTPYLSLSNWNKNNNNLLSRIQFKLTTLRIKLRKKININ